MDAFIEKAKRYSRHASQSIRIVYRDIGSVDSAMEPGEAQPQIAPPPAEAVLQFAEEQRKVS